MPTSAASAQSRSTAHSPSRDDDFEHGLLRQSICLRPYAYSLARNRADAEDLLQETFLRAWTYRDHFRTGTNMQAWLRTILRNQFFSQHRRRRVQVDLEEVRDEVGLATSPTQEIAVELRQAIIAIERSQKAQREVMMLAAFEELTMQEIADLTGEPVGTIKSRLHRARSELRGEGDVVHTSQRSGSSPCSRRATAAYKAAKAAKRPLVIG